MQSIQIFTLRGKLRACASSLQALALGVVLGVTASCSSLDESISKMVIIEYDQSLNFQRYHFEGPVMSEPDNEDWTTILGYPETGEGVWLTYNICKFGNTGSKAEDFTYDLSKFYVVWEEQTFFYQPMAAYTYKNLDGLPATPLDIDEVWEQFHEEVQLGKDSDLVANGTIFTAPIRIAIYVIDTPKPADNINAVDIELRLRYDGGSHLMEGRNQRPAKRRIGETTTKGDLPTVCRPPSD